MLYTISSVLLLKGTPGHLCYIKTFFVLGGDHGNFQSKTPILTEAKRWRSLSCPSYCSKDASPVCGSDGVIYMNDCERRKRTCNQSKSNSILNQRIIFTLEQRVFIFCCDIKLSFRQINS